MTDRARILEVHQSDPVCLARFKAEKIDGIDRETPAAKVGTACHRAAEALAYALEDAELDGSEQFAVAAQVIETAAVELHMDSNAKADAMQLMERACAPTSRIRFGKPTGWLSSAEYVWRLNKNFKPCAEGEPALAAGAIDRLDWNETEGQILVTDWKTTKSWQKQEDINGSWQARCYSLAVLSIFQGARSVTFRFSNLRNGYPVKDDFDRGGPWMETTKSRIREIRAEREVAVEMDSWPATMGPDCGYCPIKHNCAEWKKAAAEGREIPADMPDAVAAQRVLGLRAILSAYEKHVEGIVETTQAPVDIGHGIGLGMKPATKWMLAERFEDRPCETCGATGTLSAGGPPDDPREGPCDKCGGTGTRRGYERLMRALRDLKMTPEQEIEWFRYTQEHHVPGKVKDALYELLGPRLGKQAIEDGAFVEPATRFEFSPWLIDRVGKPKRPTIEEIDAAVDTAFAGG